MSKVVCKKINRIFPSLVENFRQLKEELEKPTDIKTYNREKLVSLRNAIRLQVGGIKKLIDRLKGVEFVFTPEEIKDWLEKAIEEDFSSMDYENGIDFTVDEKGHTTFQLWEHNLPMVQRVLTRLDNHITSVSFIGGPKPFQNTMGAEVVANILRDKYNIIQNLDLSSNYFEKEKVIIVLEAMKDINCFVESLDLSDAKLEHEEIKKLCEVIKTPTNRISHIDLSHQPISDPTSKDSAMELASALVDPNNEVESLRLASCLLNESFLEIIKAFKAPDNNLEIVDFSGVDLDLESTKKLVEALNDPNCKVREITLYDSLNDDTDQKIWDELEKLNRHIIINSGS